MDVKNKNSFTFMNFRKAGLVITIVLVAAIFLLNRKDVTLAKQDNFELNAVSTTGAEFKSVIHLHNPNLLSSTIKIIDEKFSINGIQIAQLSIDMSQGIPGLKETAFPVSVRFSKEDYYNAVRTDSTMSENAEVLIEGEINFENLTGNGTIKIHQTETIAVKDL